MKRHPIAMAVLAAACSVAAGAVSAEPRVVLPHLRVASGVEFRVPVALESAPGLAAMGVDITYDPAVLEALGADVGPLGEGMMLDAGLRQPGLAVLCLAGGQEKTQGDGELVSVRFRAKGGTSQTSPLRLRYVRGWRRDNELDVVFQSVEGSVTVTAALPWFWILAGLVAIVFAALLLGWKRRQSPPASAGTRTSDNSAPARGAASASSAGKRAILTCGALLLAGLLILFAWQYRRAEHGWRAQPADSGQVHPEPQSVLPDPSTALEVRSLGAAESSVPVGPSAAPLHVPSETAGGADGVGLGWWHIDGHVARKLGGLEPRGPYAAGSAEAAVARAKKLYREKQDRECEQAVREALARKPGFAPLQNNLGVVLLDLERLDESEQAFREAVRLAPGVAWYHNHLGVSLACQKRYADALAAYREANRLMPLEVVFVTNMGRTLANDNRLDEAVREFERAIGMDSNDAAAWFELGKARARLKEHRASEEALRQSVAKDPGNPQYLAELATNLHNQGRYAEAVELYDRTLALDPGNGLLEARIAGSLFHCDRVEEARQHAAKARELGIVDHWVFEELGEAGPKKGQ